MSALPPKTDIAEHHRHVLFMPNADVNARSPRSRAGFIISLPRELWETVLPITWLFPILACLAARYRPAFSAAGAQAAILVVALSAYVLAALFAERRKSAEQLAQSNTMLEREPVSRLSQVMMPARR
jgi:TRAP-type uncharacterized transport system fused permease subunit